MNDRQLETALAYLNEHSGRYSVEALRGQLLNAGYDPGTVARAVAFFQREAFPGEAPRAEGPGVGHYVGLVLLVILAVLINSGLAAVATTASLSAPNHPSDTSHFHFVTTLFVVEAVGAFAMLFPEQNPEARLRDSRLPRPRHRGRDGQLRRILHGQHVGTS